MNYGLVRKYAKEEWEDLWNSKYYDCIVCESISTNKFAWLEIEKGQVIQTSKSGTNLDFSRIIDNIYDMGKNEYSPDPKVGGWRKFANESIKIQQHKREKPLSKPDLTQQKRKHGRGWLNQIREMKKNRKK